MKKVRVQINEKEYEFLVKDNAFIRFTIEEVSANGDS